MKSNRNLMITGLITICMMMITLAQAQSESSIGLRAGVNISKQEFKQGGLTVEPKSKFGLDLAVVADIPLGDVVSIGPELHWLQKGYVIEDIGGPIEDLSATFNYLELPLLIKFNFGETAKFFVMGGPSVGYLLSGKIDNNGTEEDPDWDFINRLELGAHLGAGIGLGPIVIDVRYLLGISNLSKDIPDAEVHNTGFGGGVSLMF
jgi:hypothetical protein